MLSVVGLFFFPRIANAGMRARLRVRAYTRVLYHTRAQKCAHNTRVNTSHARFSRAWFTWFFGIYIFHHFAKNRANCDNLRDFSTKKRKTNI